MSYPVGVGDLPGESPAEVRYQTAYEDDDGYAAAVREQVRGYIDGLSEKAVTALLGLDADVLYELAYELAMLGVESREEYAERIAEQWNEGEDPDDARDRRDDR